MHGFGNSRMATIAISEETMENFRTEVLRKHRKLYAALREESEAALISWTEHLRKQNDQREKKVKASR